MRSFAFLLPFFFLVACSSSTPTPERAANGTPQEKQAAARTDQCLDNPELAKSWGDCNVKNTVYMASSQLEKCRKNSPGAHATVNFELHILPDGKVKSANLLGAKHNKHTNCLARVFQKLQFAPPPNGYDATITVPYQLEP
jgi:hypothetical protein